MTSRNRFLLVLLGIVTLGVYPLVIFNRKSRTEHLTTATIRVDIDKLVAILGTKKNISGVEYTTNKLKVFIYDRNAVDMKLLTTTKHIYSVFLSQKYVSFIVGPSAKLVAEAISSRIAH